MQIFHRFSRSGTFHTNVFVQSGTPFQFQKHISDRAPSLHGNYSASSLLRAHPTPDSSRQRVMDFPSAFFFRRPDRVSRVLDLSFGARDPLSPRRAR